MRGACLLLWFAVVSSARADGGLLICSEVRDARRITVFTMPTPPRVGTIDVSILVQDATAGQPLFDMPMSVIAFPIQGDKKKLRALATQEAATNKLMRAVQFELYEAGQWQVEIVAVGLSGDPLQFTLDVRDSAPVWIELNFWLSWPLVLIALFALHQWIVIRRSGAARLPQSTTPPG